MVQMAEYLIMDKNDEESFAHAVYVPALYNCLAKVVALRNREDVLCLLRSAAPSKEGLPTP